MDKDCAIIIASAATRAAEELISIMPLVSNSDEKIKLSIATIIYDIMESVIVPIKDGNSELKDEMDTRIDKYGRAF